MDIQQLKSCKILLIGDSCIDRYNYGSCERISPEAPVPILKTTKVEDKPGMVLNVQKNLESLGHETMVLTNMEKIIKERFVDQKTMQHLLRVDAGEAHRLNPMKLSLIETIRKSGFQYDCVVVSDYDKGFICGSNCSDIIKSLQGEKTIVFVDSKKTDLSCYENCIIKLNELEYSRITKGPINSQMIVTLGSEGARWMSEPDKIYSPPQSVDVFDVCGAGDTFMSAFVTAYMSTFSIPSSIEFANRCASISVKNFGNYVLSLEDIK